MENQQSSDDIENFIRERFEENFQQLVLESGHTLTADVKQTALQQVLLYWRKLSDIANRVTDTEVHLTLPNQTTPQDRQYTIEGVVDIVREDERVVMYDIKTHDADYVRANLGFYSQQLNVYAHIWKELRHQPLDEMAVIATDFPEYVRGALNQPDERILQAALENWDPMVPIDFDPALIDLTLYRFGEVVDQIENGRFAPPPLDVLQSSIAGVLTHERFGTRICRQCDARFSCDSYRQYARGGRRTAEGVMAYFTDDYADQESWRTAGLETAI